MHITIYLDVRRANADGTYNLRLRLSHAGQQAMISTGLSVRADQYRDGKVTKHPAAALYNANLSARRVALEGILLTAPAKCADMSATELRDWLLDREAGKPEGPDSVLLVDIYEEYMQSREAKRTREIYATTLRRLQEYDARLCELHIEDVTPRWLDGLDRHLSRTSPSVNARNIHMRNIRAVCNYALDNEITTYYPFRRYKLRYRETDKRAITIEELRAFFALPPQGRNGQLMMDMLRLIYYLIGINVTDLWGLPSDAIRGGRLHYRRAKTHRLYSIRVEPETAAIIDKYRGRAGLLCVRDMYADAHNLVKALDRFAGRLRAGMTTYVLRHTWATVAYNDLHASRDVISQALGHQTGSEVTAVYIKPDARLVDELNRQMINHLLCL